MIYPNVEPFDNKFMHLFMLSMGKIFRVVAITDTNEEANRIMESNPEAALIACDPRGRCYIAEQYGSVAPSELITNVREKTRKRFSVPRA